MIEQYAADFESDYEASAEQRDNANEELRFMLVAGGQWEGYLETEYENRAKMEVDQTSEYLWRTYADWCDNRMGVNYSPDDDETTQDEADLLDGLLRRDMRRKGGEASVDTAVMECMACGMGAVMLNTEYDDDEDPESPHQNVCITELPNAYSLVVFDAGARRADKSDASRVTIVTPYTREQFEEKWPGKDPGQMGVQNRSFFNWSTRNFVYVGTRYHVDRKNTWISSFANPMGGEVVRIEEGDGYDDDVRELKAFGYRLIRRKKIKQRTVFKTVFSGHTELEAKRRVAGKFLPVIPFYGFRAFIDGMEVFHGLARKRMDAQRMLNMSVSLVAESAAHAHDGKPIFAPEQVSGLKGVWAKNWHSQPYLLADPLYNEDGSILHAGPTGSIEGSTIAPAAAALIQMTHEFIRIGTGGAPQDIADPEASGKAINALIKRIDKNTRPVFNNIKMSMKHLGMVYRSIAAEVYGGKTNQGRVIRRVNDRNETEPVKLLMPKARMGSMSLANDVSRGKFEPVVDVTKDYGTEQEETVEALKDILLALTPNDPLRRDIINEIILKLDASGLKDLKKRIRQSMLLQGAEPESDEEKEFLQKVANAPKGDDPNSLLMKAAAAEQQTEAMKNAQEVRQMEFENQETAARTKKLLAEAYEILKTQPAEVSAGATLQ